MLFFLNSVGDTSPNQTKNQTPLRRESLVEVSEVLLESPALSEVSAMRGDLQTLIGLVTRLENRFSRLESVISPFLDAVTEDSSRKRERSPTVDLEDELGTSTSKRDRISADSL